MSRVPLTNVTLMRLAAVGLAVLAVAVVAVRSAASRSSSANALPSALAPVARQLARDHDIHLHRLPAGTTVHVSPSEAETIARRDFGHRRTSDMSAFAVSVTDKAWGKPQPDGTLKLKMVNRRVWVVLLPKQHMPVTTGPPVTASLAVFVDANKGHYLMAASFYP